MSDYSSDNPYISGSRPRPTPTSRPEVSSNGEKNNAPSKSVQPKQQPQATNPQGMTATNPNGTMRPIWNRTASSTPDGVYDLNYGKSKTIPLPGQQTAAQTKEQREIEQLTSFGSMKKINIDDQNRSSLLINFSICEKGFEAFCKNIPLFAGPPCRRPRSRGAHPGARR